MEGSRLEGDVELQLPELFHHRGQVVTDSIFVEIADYAGTLFNQPGNDFQVVGK